MKTNVQLSIWMAAIALAIGGVLLSRHMDSIHRQQSRLTNDTYLYEAADMIDNQHYVSW